MFNNLVGLGYGLVTFAIIIGVGSIVLYNFGGSVGNCNVASCGSAGAFNVTNGGCYNATNAQCATAPTGTQYTNIAYMNTQMGTSGIAGWTPAIIAVAVGLLFLGAFAIGKGRD